MDWTVGISTILMVSIAVATRLWMSESLAVSSLIAELTKILPKLATVALVAVGADWISVRASQYLCLLLTVATLGIGVATVDQAYRLHYNKAAPSLVGAMIYTHLVASTFCVGIAAGLVKRSRMLKILAGTIAAALLLIYCPSPDAALREAGITGCYARPPPYSKVPTLIVLLAPINFGIRSGLRKAGGLDVG